MDAAEILATVNAHATTIYGQLDVAALALGGAFERQYETQPGLRGIRTFQEQADGIIGIAIEHTGELLQTAQNALSAHLAAFPEHGHVDARNDTHDAQGLREATLTHIRALLVQGAVAYARKFRLLLLARSPASQISEEQVRAQYRNGARVRLSEALYLVTRQSLLDHFNQGRVVDLRNAGQSIAQLVHEDPEHATHNLPFTLVPGLDLPNYADLVADGYLHPRANAIVGAR